MGLRESGYYVARRACGSCRFFEQSDIGESGWCRNQRCREIVGIALVRRQELACRIGWDQDYYESAAGANDVLPGQNRPVPDPARQRSGYQGMRPDDIIVGVEQPRPVTEEPLMHVARSRTSNVGEAHRRALERRQIAQQSGDAVPQRRLDTIVAPTGASGSSGERHDDRHSSPRATVVGDEGVGRPQIAGSIPPQPTVPHASHAAVTANFPVTPRHDSPDPSAASPYRAAPPGAQIASAPPTYQQPLPPRQAESAPAHFNSAPGSPAVHANGQMQPLEADWYAAERQRHRGKRCANCRDFQTAESGDRGWCRNRFAFPTPQLVGPNDLACLSCIGTWWAANDQWWLAKATSAQQIAATPLADALLEEMHEDEKRQTGTRRPGAG